MDTSLLETLLFFFFSSRRRHTRCSRDWSSDVCSSDLGREGLVDDTAARVSAAVDGLVPRWIVRPRSLEHVSRVLALAWDAELAVVPRGGGNALALGHPPSRLDLVLDLRRLDRVVEYNPDDLTVTVEAGTTMGALAARVGARRQLLPLDPAGVERAALGGVPAPDAS